MNAVLPILLFAVAGFLLGGGYTLWKTSRVAAGAVLVIALLAVGGGVAWLL